MQQVNEPSEESRKYYCRPQMNNECTALVLVPDDKVYNQDTSKVSDRIQEMVNALENGKGKQTNRIKEKGIVITVKKNKIIENEEQTSDNQILPENEKKEGEGMKDKGITTNKSNHQIDILDYEMEEEIAFEPLF